MGPKNASILCDENHFTGGPATLGSQDWTFERFFTFLLLVLNENFFAKTTQRLGWKLGKLKRNSWIEILMENTHQSSWKNMIPSVQPCWFVEIYFQMICHLVAGMTSAYPPCPVKGVSAKFQPDSTRSPTRETFEHQFFEVDVLAILPFL